MAKCPFDGGALADVAIGLVIKKHCQRLAVRNSGAMRVRKSHTVNEKVYPPTQRNVVFICMPALCAGIHAVLLPGG